MENNTLPDSSMEVSLSVICPCLNEEEYIADVLEFFCKSKPSDKELYLVDGGSADRTRQIISEYQKENSNIKLLHNPERYVPFALNKAIPLCVGDIIVRIDAHSVYAENYFEKILETFLNVNADIVGGPTRTKCNAPFQCAVARAICSRFGVGNSLVHNLSYEGYTDSVTFGAWKQAIFSETGLFDVALVRNQDDEFHYRAKSRGKKIYQNPDIKVWYYPRHKITSLFSQYYQYGLYKPAVLRKVNSEIKARHLVPSCFLLYLLTLPLVLVSGYWLVPLFLYLLCSACFAFSVEGDAKVKFLTMLVFPTLHIAYGLGFLCGLIKR